ncbi:nucleoside triphosphate pyrophosphatase [Lentzea sp. BCCO 10_0061]|uniref:Nucleoside triphosphate pyrophosphatase n=1 Tax=Lentzea sokolovensis TaxID=3095429 RepID=A0ABU4UTJ8_9PSEU|nr:nucleoside triphosphate pyrophosphatase [Lentzea sp. BCCO 10_0061]MDX8142826.1 nucleoside triphosphate pyrophosphatase [Lentzea sp. BCCO 10_0061]
MRLILASQSPARLSVLRSAGIEPVVRVSGVDEDALIASLDNPTPEETVVVLSAAKAEAIEHDDDCVVVGCDSMLLFEGELVGKPGTPEVALERWRRVAGKSGVLITGHTVLRVAAGEIAGRASASESTTVRFGTPSEEELEAYIATGEPLHVAGGFTIDGLGGWFIDGIDGDHTSVIGISLPLTRRLLSQVGVSVSTLW